MTGDGAETPETLFLLSPVDATPTLVLALGRGDDGEALAFNPDDGLLYHASGWRGDFDPETNKGVIFESIDPRTLTIRDIPIVDTALIYEEAQALTYWKAQGVFLWKQHHNPGPLFRVTPGGVPTLIGEMDHQAKGLAFAK